MKRFAVEKQNQIKSNLMEGGAEKKRRRESKKKKKDFECDGKAGGGHGRPVEVSASVMGLFSEFAFTGCSGGQGKLPPPPPPLDLPSRKSKGKKKLRRRRGRDRPGSLLLKCVMWHTSGDDPTTVGFRPNLLTSFFKRIITMTLGEFSSFVCY